MHSDFLQAKILLLRGPILVLGASGFVGANLLKRILEVRQDAYGTAFATPSWRLQDVPDANVITVYLLVPRSARTVMEKIQPGSNSSRLCSLRRIFVRNGSRANL